MLLPVLYQVSGTLLLSPGTKFSWMFCYYIVYICIFMISLGLFFIVVVLSLLLFCKWEQKEGLGIKPRVSSILSNHSILKPNPTFLKFCFIPKQVLSKFPRKDSSLWSYSLSFPTSWGCRPALQGLATFLHNYFFLQIFNYLVISKEDMIGHWGILMVTKVLNNPDIDLPWCWLVTVAYLCSFELRFIIFMSL